MQPKQCVGCAYWPKNSCTVFTKPPENCWNYTTQEEADKRKAAMDEYVKFNGCGRNWKNKGKRVGV
jgi:hypothetical protein